MLGIIAKHSPRNFYRLRIYHHGKSNLPPETLESFFISWGKRTPQRSLILTIFNNRNLGLTSKENKMILEKYKNLGVIRVSTDDYDADEYLFD